MRKLSKNIALLFLVGVYGLALGQVQTDGSEFDSKNEARTYVDSLSQQCWKLRGTNADSALTVGLKAVDLAKKYGLEKQFAQTSNFVGVVYMHYLYKYKEAIPHFQDAMQSSLLLKDSVQLGYAYNNLGDVYLLSGNLPLAFQYGRRSLEIFKSINHSAGLAYAYVNLAEAYRAQKDFQNSLLYFEKALELRNNENIKSNAGFVYFNQANTFEQSGNLDEAMRFYQKALDLNYDSPDLRYVSWCLSGIANIYYAQGNYVQAYSYYKKGFDWDIERAYEHGIVNNQLGMALVNAHQNKVKEGEYLLQEALSVAKRLEINALSLKAYKSFFEFYKIRGDFDKVTESFEIFLTQYDSILSAQQFEIINELEQNYLIQQNLLNTEQELAIAKFRRYRLIIIVLVMAAVMLVLIYLYRLNRRMNKKLAEMNRTKDQLFSVISHDLRNPFNSLIGFSDILLEELKNKNYEEAETYATYLNKSSNEGYAMLNNLLDWSMSQSGRIQFKPELFDFENFFKEIEQYCLTQNEKYGVQLKLENSIYRQISADANVLRIILINLLTNAFKYTPSGARVQLKAKIEQNVLVLCVEDSGIGMTPEKVAQLLDKTQNVKSEHGLRNEKGIGLGIQIIHELIQIHKGNMQIRSEKGKGTSFELHFPIGVHV